MPLRGVTARLVAAMAMIGGIAHTQRAAIRLQLEGLWSVKEFSSTLSNLATAYDAAVALHYLGTEEFLGSQELLAWIPPSDARGSDDLNATIFSLTTMGLNGIRLRASLSGMPLQFQRVQLGSPGLMEAAGLLNPLRTVLGFVVGLRSQDVDREHGQPSHTLELLDRIPDPVREHSAAPLLGDIEHTARAIARDRRVGNIDVIPSDD